MLTKRTAALFLAIILALASWGALAQEQAISVKPGEVFEAEFVLTDNPNNAVAAIIMLDYSHEVFELLPSDSIKNDHPLLNVALGGLTAGTAVKATFRAAESMAEGTYTIIVVTEQAGDYNENEVPGLSFSSCMVHVTVPDEVQELVRRGEQLYEEEKYEEAFSAFRAACEQGSSGGAAALGRCYEEGHGVEKDTEKAVSYYRQAADQGNTDALNNLGRCYSKGIGVAQDYAEAAKYYQASADLGDSTGQYELANLYFIGKGVPRDFEQVVKYSLLAASQGNPAAQYNLGFCYENGLGVSMDLQEAKKYYQLAADQGHETAKQVLANWKD